MPVFSTENHTINRMPIFLTENQNVSRILIFSTKIAPLVICLIFSTENAIESHVGITISQLDVQAFRDLRYVTKICIIRAGITLNLNYI